MVDDTVLCVEGLFIFGNAGFEAGGLHPWLSTIHVGLVSDILPQVLLFLLVNLRHLLTVHVVRLLILVIWLDRLTTTLERALAAGISLALLPSIILPRGRPLASLLREHLFVLGQRVLL